MYINRKELADTRERINNRISEEVKWLRHEIKELRDALNDVYNYDVSQRLRVEKRQAGSVLRLKMSQPMAQVIPANAEKQPG